METLWAPWRMAYIDAPRHEGCVFCTAPGADDLREQLVLHRGKHCFLLMNLFPYNNGHLMIAPYRHTADFPGLRTEEQSELMALTQYGVRLLTEAFHPQGFNLGMNLGSCAGAGIADHLHMHIVPRWSGDTNFMPVLADTNVLPDSLFASYDKLLAAAERLGAPV